MKILPTNLKKTATPTDGRDKRQDENHYDYLSGL
jgi:hypothetical protein